MDHHDQPTPDETPREVDDGLAFAYGEDSQPDSAPSVLHRVREITGLEPEISLRDADESGQTPMLKPLGPDKARSAGRYVVHGMLGQGGVGTVHRGHDQDLGRDVALKFLHEKYSADPGVLHRFVEEAQIGGQLQHPGIVPVYELGMADDRPFFAMKMIKGQTLAKKLTDRSSPADERRTFLSIFEDVCQTMAYAHARGVVHRDLKPANIMVGSFGEVQVVDWGMGKVLASGGVADEKAAAERQSKLSVIETVRSSGHGTQSVMGSVMGTPAYMPPEQARGNVEAMDERSDVFALGAILCELLTGQPPYVGAHDELIGMAAMAKLDDAHARLAQCGADDDLVELATQCLMPAPAARPQSAEQVARAVHDHLAAAEARVHEARVEAAEAKVRAASLRRQRAMGLALTLAVFIGLGFSLWLWRDAEEQRDLADAQRKVAENQRDQIDLVATFMGDMLAWATPINADGRDTELLQDMLEATATRIESGELDDSPIAELRLRVNLAAALNDIEDFKGASDLFEPAPAIAESLYSRRSSEYLATLELAATFKPGEAHAIQRERLRISRDLHGTEDHEDTVAALKGLSSCLRKWGVLRAGSQHDRLAEAERRIREAAAMGRRLFRQDPARISPGQLADVLQEGAWICLERGQFGDARVLMKEALVTAREQRSDDHPAMIELLLTMAETCEAQGLHDDSNEYVREALASVQRAYVSPRPDDVRVGRSLLGLASKTTLSSFRLPLLQQSIQLLESHRDLDALDVVTLYKCWEQICLIHTVEVGGSWNRRVAGTREGTAFRTVQGDWARGLDAGREALRIHREHRLPVNPWTLHLAMGKGAALAGDDEQATRHFMEALRHAGQGRTEDHIDLARANFHIGMHHANSSRWEEAIPYQQAAVDMIQRLVPNDDVEKLALMVGLLNSLQAANGFDAGKDILAAALPIARRLGHTPSLPRLCNEHAIALRRAGDLAGAEPLFREAVKLSKQAGVLDGIVRAQAGLGVTLQLKGAYADAAQELEEAEREAKKAALARHASVIVALVDCYESWHKAEPGGGHDEQAALWRKRLEAARRKD